MHMKQDCIRILIQMLPALEVMQLISSTGKLEPETEEKLRQVLEAYTENFLNTRPEK